MWSILVRSVGKSFLCLHCASFVCFFKDKTGWKMFLYGANGVHSRRPCMIPNSKNCYHGHRCTIICWYDDSVNSP